MAYVFANNAKSRLNVSVTNIATTFTLATGGGTKFPSPTGGDFFTITLFEYDDTGEINHEICHCTTRSGDTLTVTRGEEGTTARAWDSLTPVELRVTRDTLNEFSTDTDITNHGAVSSNIHGVTGTVVGTTDTQTLTNKTIVAANNTVTTAANGNLTSTELNAALAELQSDIDTRELEGNALAFAIALG